MQLFLMILLCTLQVPNGIGFLLGASQLVVYLIYRSSETALPISPELHKLAEINKIDNSVEVKASNVVKVAAVFMMFNFSLID